MKTEGSSVEGKKTISVILASYNGEKYIIEQLESIANQTIKADEVLISDDNSTDNTFAIVSNFIKENNLTGWHIDKNEINLGWRRNFANLALKAKGDFVFFCDQDDIWYPEKISQMVEVLILHDDIELLVSDLDAFYMSDDVQTYRPVSLGRKEYQKIRLKPEWVWTMRPGCAFAARRALVQECFSEVWKEGLAHDLLLWQLAFAKKSIGYRQISLMRYRRFLGNTTGQKIDSKKDQRILENTIILESLTSVLHYCRRKGITVPRAMRRRYKLENRREVFFHTKTFRAWLSCLMFIDCYPAKRSWIADYFYLVEQ